MTTNGMKMMNNTTPTPGDLSARLPELPEPQRECWIGHTLYTADQMRAYAIAALSALPAASEAERLRAELHIAHEVVLLLKARCGATDAQVDEAAKVAQRLREDWPGEDYWRAFYAPLVAAYGTATTPAPVAASGEVCVHCEDAGVYAVDGSGPFDCYACGKKATTPPPAAVSFDPARIGPFAAAAAMMEPAAVGAQGEEEGAVTCRVLTFDGERIAVPSRIFRRVHDALLAEIDAALNGGQDDA